MQLAPAALGSVSWLVLLAAAWAVIDGLWPLWDTRRQAIHDRAAGTSVVRVR